MILAGAATAYAQQTPPATAAPQQTPAAQQRPAARPPSPVGTAATQVGWGTAPENERAKVGKWIEITYGRPVLRGRKNIFGTGAEYGKGLYAGAPVWRAGANVSTRLKTDVPLQFGDKTVPAGEYSLFIELGGENNWTLIVSSYNAAATGRGAGPDALWGSYNYKPDKDVARVKMDVGKLQMSLDQLTWAFADVTSDGGRIAIAWDTTLASAPFKVVAQ
jgi:hypothetical protein